MAERKDFRRYPRFNGEIVFEMWDTDEAHLDEMVETFRSHVELKYPGLEFDVGLSDIVPQVWGRDPFIVLTARQP